LPLSEKAWQDQVIQLAQMYGWRVYHPFDSRRSVPGYPDLTLVNKTLVMAELKTDRGRLSPEQREWLEALDAAGVETHVWRPRDVDAVVARLFRR